MKVFVTGGSGYVGNVVVKHLIEAGHEVTCLVRPGHRPIDGSQVRTWQGDITDPTSLRNAMKESEAVIHLVGIIREVPSKGMTMNRIHVDGTRNVMEEAARSGVRHVLHMSALHARKDAVSDYHRTKYLAENIVKDSGIPFTIFRPSVIFGKGGRGPNFVAQLVDLLSSSPIVPVIGNGEFLLQPVSVENVAQGFVRSLQTTDAINAEFEVGGPEQISYYDILRTIADAMQKKLRTISVPVGIMKTMVPIMQRFPAFPITKDQLQMLLEGNVCTDSRSFFEKLQIAPTPFEVNLSDYR